MIGIAVQRDRPGSQVGVVPGGCDARAVHPRPVSIGGAATPGKRPRQGLDRRGLTDGAQGWRSG